MWGTWPWGRSGWAGIYLPAIWTTHSFFSFSKGFWMEQDTFLWAPLGTITDVSRPNRPWAFWTMASAFGGRHFPWWSLHWILGFGYQPWELQLSWIPPFLNPSKEMWTSEPIPVRDRIEKDQPLLAGCVWSVCHLFPCTVTVRNYELGEAHSRGLHMHKWQSRWSVQCGYNIVSREYKEECLMEKNGWHLSICKEQSP